MIHTLKSRCKHVKLGIERGFLNGCTVEATLLYSTGKRESSLSSISSFFILSHSSIDLSLLSSRASL